MKSGFEKNPIGYTGFIVASPTKESDGCFHQAIVFDVVGDKLKVETNYGAVGVVNKSDFTPMMLLRKAKKI